jgi:K+-sensing histidine kinase KdpD
MLSHLFIEATHPREGWNQFLFGFVAQTLAEISDEKWKDIQADAKNPCNVVNCDCHLVHQDILEAMDKFRKYSKHTKQLGLNVLSARAKKN